jgi:hypothetical protein
MLDSPTVSPGADRPCDLSSAPQRDPSPVRDSGPEGGVGGPRESRAPIGLLSVGNSPSYGASLHCSSVTAGDSAPSSRLALLVSGRISSVDQPVRRSGGGRHGVAPPRRAWSLALALLVLAAATPVHAQLAAPLEAAVHLKTLGYAPSFLKRVQNRIRIAVVARNDAAALKVQKGIVAGFTAVGRQVKNLSVTTVPITYAADTFAAELVRSQANLIYVTPGMEANLPALLDIAQQSRIPTMCGDLILARQGVVIVVYNRAGKPGLGINVRAARNVGIAFDSALFSIAQVIK